MEPPRKSTARGTPKVKKHVTFSNVPESRTVIQSQFSGKKNQKYPFGRYSTMADDRPQPREALRDATAAYPLSTRLETSHSASIALPTASERDWSNYANTKNLELLPRDLLKKPTPETHPPHPTSPLDTTLAAPEGEPGAKGGEMSGGVERRAEEKEKERDYTGMIPQNYPKVPFATATYDKFMGLFMNSEDDSVNLEGFPEEGAGHGLERASEGRKTNVVRESLTKETIPSFQFTSGFDCGTDKMDLARPLKSRILNEPSQSAQPTEQIASQKRNFSQSMIASPLPTTPPPVSRNQTSRSSNFQFLSSDVPFHTEKSIAFNTPKLLKSLLATGGEENGESERKRRKSEEVDFNLNEMDSFNFNEESNLSMDTSFDLLPKDYVASPEKATDPIDFSLGMDTSFLNSSGEALEEPDLPQEISLEDFLNATNLKAQYAPLLSSEIPNVTPRRMSRIPQQPKTPTSLDSSLKSYHLQNIIKEESQILRDKIDSTKQSITLLDAKRAVWEKDIYNWNELLCRMLMSPETSEQEKLMIQFKLKRLWEKCALEVKLEEQKALYQYEVEKSNRLKERCKKFEEELADLKRKSELLDITKQQFEAEKKTFLKNYQSNTRHSLSPKESLAYQVKRLEMLTKLLGWKPIKLEDGEILISIENYGLQLLLDLDHQPIVTSAQLFLLPNTPIKNKREKLTDAWQKQYKLINFDQIASSIDLTMRIREVVFDVTLFYEFLKEIKLLKLKFRANYVFSEEPLRIHITVPFYSATKRLRFEMTFTTEPTYPKGAITYTLKNQIGKISLETIAKVFQEPKPSALLLILYRKVLSLMSGLNGAALIEDVLRSRPTSVEETIQVIQNKTTLKTWNFENWKEKFGEGGARLLAEAFKTNTTLTTLNLRNSEVGDHGAYQMFVSLQFNLFSKLTKVTLSENHVGNKAVAAIAAVLKCNRIMKYLDLKVNSIGDEGAICLAEALEVNSTLENLDLSGNWIADKGANRIATALTRNYSLVTFFLSKNRITEEGILNVIRALKRNQGLEEINIRDNFFMERNVVHTLNATLKVNASLTKVDFTQFTTTSNETRELLSINTNYMPWRRMAKAWPKTHFLLPNKDNEIECLLIIFALYSIPKEIKIAIIRTIILTKLTNKIAQFK